MIDIEHLLRIPFVDHEGGFDISPEGTHLAFAWNITGQWEIYELDLNASGEPRPVSAGAGSKFAPHYSPDGSCLAYTVDFDGGENFHIFIHKRNTTQYRDLTPDIGFTIQPYLCWSPGGGHIAFLSNQSGCFSAYIMPVNGGEAALVLDNGLPAVNVTWSPDGRYLAVMFIARGQDYNIYIIPLDGSEPFPIGDKNGPINAHNPDWSPDATKIAFHSDSPNGFHQVGILDVNLRQISWLTGADKNCRTPSWSKEGMQLTYSSALGATDKVLIHPIGASARAFQVETGVHHKPRFTPDGKHIILIFTNPRHPPDLWKLALESGEFCQLTYSMNRSAFGYAQSTEVAMKDFPIPEEIAYPGMDGTPVPALLFKADNADHTTPAVIVIHGGPNWHFQMDWYPFMLHLASRGWTVLAPNYRGSTGYSRDWQLANRFNLGGVDTDDVTAGVRYLLDRSIANPKRIAVTGRSHGGYLTMSCLTRYPDLWCAGSAMVPFLNWFTSHENSRADLQHWDLENFGDPRENYDLWYERSPFFFLERVKAPVQLICAENDPRCPASESTRARDKLLEHGKEVDFHLYLGEGHAFLKTENVVDAEERRVNFLAKALE